MKNLLLLLLCATAFTVRAGDMAFTGRANKTETIARRDVTGLKWVTNSSIDALTPADFKRFAIGAPKGTEHHTGEALLEMGLCGLYLEVQ